MRYTLRLVAVIAVVPMAVLVATSVFFLTCCCWGLQAVRAALNDEQLPVVKRRAHSPKLEEDPIPKHRGPGFMVPLPFNESQTSNSDASTALHDHPATFAKHAPLGAQPKNENDR